MLDGQDVFSFYLFLEHYNLASPNIGVVGTTKEFDKYMKKVIQKYKDKRNVVIKKFDNRVMIIQDEIELTYINIQNTVDLINEDTGEKIYFKRFMTTY